MADTTNITLLSDLIDPQVLADEIDLKLIDRVRFAPLATIDDTLVGRDGDEISMPYYGFVGAAVTIPEAGAIPIRKLETGVKKVKVSKIGMGISYTDEALLAGHNNNIAAEATNQIITSIADGIDNKFLAEMATATVSSNVQANGNIGNDIIDGVMQFGEDMDGDKVLVVPASVYGRIVKSGDWIPNTDRGADIIIRGSQGQIAGCQVVVSNRLNGLYDYTEVETPVLADIGTYYEKDMFYKFTLTSDVAIDPAKTYYTRTDVVKNKAFIVKPGALRLVRKRQTLVEFDRDKQIQTNYVFGSDIFAPYLYDQTKIVMLNLL